MTLERLLELIKRPTFQFGKYVVISQEPGTISDGDSIATARYYLPAFILAWNAIEEVTGHRWRCTSYIRNSPSHIRGQAFDLAPDIHPSAAHAYAVTNQSDPVLYKREPLIRALQSLRMDKFGDLPMGAFIEPDHIHLQILKPNSGERFPFSVIKWKIAKPIYPDTFERMKLPLIQ